MNKVLRMIGDKKYRFFVMERLGITNIISDKKFLELMFLYRTGKHLNLETPGTFNEKLQWLKLYDRKPEYTTMVDKYAVKKYVADKIGEQYIVPTLGVWDRFEDIDFDNLPDQFVLKCTHDSGGLVICRDKSKLDRKAAKKKIERSLKRNYYYLGREWPYKNVQRKIIAEQYMTDNKNSREFTDYKFFCFDGYVDCVMICLDRSTGDTKFYFFDKNWDLKRLNKRGKDAPEGFTLPKPVCIDEMFEIAAKLSVGIPFVRIDLYQSNGKVYFGEMTFYPDSGFDANLLPETDIYFGNLINLHLIIEDDKK